MDMDQGLRILGLAKGANAETGRRRWRALVRQWHPDRFAQNAEMQTLAEERLKEINQAWEIVAPRLAREPKDRGGPAGHNSKRPEKYQNASRRNAATSSPRPGILRVLRRIRLRRILREIFSDPYRTSTTGSGRSGSDSALRTRKRSVRDKSFDEVFDEVLGEGQPRNAPQGGTLKKGGPTRNPRSLDASRQTSGAVNGVESPGAIGAVRRPDRVRGIGEKR